jgi:hypothetical protein
MLTCIRCSTKLTGKQTRFCSYNCKNVHGVTEWRRNAKRWAVEKLGGRCSRCGYDKCVGALHFHHVDDDKEFTFSHAGHTRSYEKLENELKKCILVCANCHAEIHEAEHSFPSSSKVERVAVNDTVAGSSPA